jgi:hypothetical protein
MFHRRLLQDDSRGVGEPLNETDGIDPYPNPNRRGTGKIQLFRQILTHLKDFTSLVLTTLLLISLRIPFKLFAVSSLAFSPHWYSDSPHLKPVCKPGFQHTLPPRHFCRMIFRKIWT